MGLKDTAAKNFFGREEIMTGLLSYAVQSAGGTWAPAGECLRLVNGESYKIVQEEDGRFRTENRYRDRLFEYDTGNGFISVGLELQTRRDTDMLHRLMVYDARWYAVLLKEGRMHPIVNLVLHFDRDGRHPPCTLVQMMPPGTPELPEGFFFNYGFVSLNIYELAENYKSFRCKELRRVLYYFKLEKEGAPLVEEELSKDTLSRDAALLCAIFLGLDIRIDDEAEEVNMCKAVREFKQKYYKEGKAEGRAEGKAEGRAEGRAEGKAEGKQDFLKKVVSNLMEMNFGLEFIARITGESMKTVQTVALSIQG